jgi:hypothetical protein
MHWTRHGSQRWEQIPLPPLLSNMRMAHFVATKAWRRDINSDACLVLSCLVLSCLVLSCLAGCARQLSLRPDGQGPLMKFFPSPKEDTQKTHEHR